MSADSGIGKPPLEARMLLLPLRSDFGEITRILGCFETHGSIGRAPRRFNVLRTELINVADRASPKTPQETLNLLRQESPSASGFAERPARFKPDQLRKSHKNPRPSYLKLVKDDD